MKKLVFIFTLLYLFICVSCNKNNDIEITKTESNIIEQEYLDQMDKKGAYLLEDDEKAVIVIIGEFERNYYSDVKLIDNDIVLTYNNESFDNSENLICKDVYLINNINKNSTIKLYHNEKEDCFVKVIACEL